MPQLIDTPEGVVEFPDGMSDDEIAGVLKSQLAPAPPPEAKPDPSVPIQGQAPAIQPQEEIVSPEQIEGRQKKVDYFDKLFDQSSQTGLDLDTYLIEGEGTGEYARSQEVGGSERDRLIAEAKSQRGVRTGTLPAGVVNGAIQISPAAAWDEEGLKKSISGLEATDTQKKTAIERIPVIKTAVAKMELPFFNELSEFKDFVQKNPNLKTPEEQIAGYKSANTGWSKRIPEQIKLGMTQGYAQLIQATQVGVGVTALLANEVLGKNGERSPTADAFLGAAIDTQGSEIESLGKMSQNVGGSTDVAGLTASVTNMVPLLAVPLGASILMKGAGVSAATASNIGFVGSSSLEGFQQAAATFVDATKKYEEGLIATGMDPRKARDEAQKKAFIPSIATGITTAAITALGGKKGNEAIFRPSPQQIEGLATDKTFLKSLKEFGDVAFKDAFQEGILEEMPQQMAQAITESLTYNPDKTLQEAVSETMQAGVYGALMGGTIGAGRNIFDKTLGRPTPPAEPATPEPTTPIPTPDESFAPPPMENTGTEPTVPIQTPPVASPAVVAATEAIAVVEQITPGSQAAAEAAKVIQEEAARLEEEFTKGGENSGKIETDAQKGQGGQEEVLTPAEPSAPTGAEVPAKPVPSMLTPEERRNAEAMAEERLDAEDAGEGLGSIEGQRKRLERVKKNHQAIRREIEDATDPADKRQLESELRSFEMQLRELAVGLPEKVTPIILDPNWKPKAKAEVPAKVEPEAVAAPIAPVVTPEAETPAVSPVEEVPAVEPVADTPKTPEQEYDASLETFKTASREFTRITKAYRAREIGDEEFLAGRKAFDAAQEASDAAETKFIRAKNTPAIPSQEKPPTQATLLETPRSKAPEMNRYRSAIASIDAKMADPELDGDRLDVLGARREVLARKLGELEAAEAKPTTKSVEVGSKSVVPETSPAPEAPVKESLTTEPAAPVEAGAKEPWQMTREEFNGHELASAKYVEEMAKLDAAGTNPPPREFMLKAATTVAHKEAIQRAIAAGKDIPAEVLAEYPKLSKPTSPAPESVAPPARDASKPADRQGVEPSRSKPVEQIVFSKPYRGPTGAEITAYSWKYKLQEEVDRRGEDVVRRVSNWDEADQSAESGRLVVHQFLVRSPDGKTNLTSLEGALRLLGYADSSEGAKPIKSLASALKTRARLQMALDRATEQADAYTKAQDEIKAIAAKLPDPEFGSEITDTKAFKDPASDAMRVSSANNPSDFQVYSPRERNGRENAIKKVVDIVKYRQAREMASQEARDAKAVPSGQIEDIQSRIKRADKKLKQMYSEAPISEAVTSNDKIAGEVVSEAVAQPARDASKPYSVQALTDTFNIPTEQAEAVDALAKSIGIDFSSIELQRGGTVAEDALAQGKDIPQLSADQIDTIKTGTPEQARVIMAELLGRYEGIYGIPKGALQGMVNIADLWFTGNTRDFRKWFRNIKENNPILINLFALANQQLHRAKYGDGPVEMFRIRGDITEGDPKETVGAEVRYGEPSMDMLSFGTNIRQLAAKLEDIDTTGDSGSVSAGLIRPEQVVISGILDKSPKNAGDGETVISAGTPIPTLTSGEFPAKDVLFPALRDGNVDRFLGQRGEREAQLLALSVPELPRLSKLPFDQWVSENIRVAEQANMTRLYQGDTRASASVTFSDEGKVLVQAFESSDVSSALHEIAHIARRQLLSDNVQNNKGITPEEITAVQEWAGAEGGKWNRSAEEKFANAFERYIREGKSPVPELQTVFQKLSAWLKDIYKTIKGTSLDVKISKVVRGVLDKMVSNDKIAGEVVSEVSEGQQGGEGKDDGKVRPSDGPSPVAPVTEVPDRTQQIERGDDAKVTLAGREVTVTVDSIRDIQGVPNAYFDYFGMKNLPLSEMTLAKKSRANALKITREKEDAERIAAQAKEAESESATRESKWDTATARTPEHDKSANAAYKKAKTTITKAKTEQDKIKPNENGFTDSARKEYDKQQAKIDAANEIIKKAQGYAQLENASTDVAVPEATPPVEAADKVNVEIETAKVDQSKPIPKVIKDCVLEQLRRELADVEKNGDQKGIVNVSIPGDGAFKILRTKMALESAIKRMAGLSTRLGPENARSTANPVIKPEAIIKAYGSPEAAYSAARRQANALEDGEAKIKAESLADTIYESTKAGKLAAQAETARRTARERENSIKEDQAEIDRINGLKKRTKRHEEDLVDLEKRISSAQERADFFNREAESYDQQAAKEKAAMEPADTTTRESRTLDDGGEEVAPLTPFDVWKGWITEPLTETDKNKLGWLEDQFRKATIGRDATFKEILQDQISTRVGKYASRNGHLSGFGLDLVFKSSWADAEKLRANKLQTQPDESTFEGGNLAYEMERDDMEPSAQDAARSAYDSLANQKQPIGERTMAEIRQAEREERQAKALAGKVDMNKLEAEFVKGLTPEETKAAKTVLAILKNENPDLTDIYYDSLGRFLTEAGIDITPEEYILAARENINQLVRSLTRTVPRTNDGQAGTVEGRDSRAESPEQSANRVAVEGAVAKEFGEEFKGRVSFLRTGTGTGTQSRVGGNWDARLNGNTIEVNLSKANPETIVDAIREELGHLIFRDPEMRPEFDALFNALTPTQQAKIRATVESLYSDVTPDIRREEILVKSIRRMAADGTKAQRSAWRRFVDWITAAWKRLTGKTPQKDLAEKILARGVREYMGGKAAEGAAESRTPRTVTPEQDARYLELAKDPEKNREELQQMVDAAARVAGYSVGPVFHGTDREFTQFDPTQINRATAGFYFAYDKAEAERYATIRTRWNGQNNRIIGAFLNPGKVATSDDVGGMKEAKEKGYESFAQGDIWVVFDPTRIKSADPVTRDTQGNVIPLSERFNPASNDIRESRTEDEHAKILDLWQPTHDVVQRNITKGNAREIVSGWLKLGGDKADLEQALLAGTDLTPHLAERTANSYMNSAARLPKEELPVIPPEDRKYAGLSPEEPRTTGLKKATVKDERLQRGLDDLPEAERQDEAERVERAVEFTAKDTEAANRLVSRILDDGNHAISPDDAAILLVERNRIMNQRAALESEEGSPLRQAQINENLNKIEEQLDRLDRAQRAAGSAWGRTGRMYQRMIREDYSLEAMERRMRRANDGPLDADQIAKIKEMADKIDDLSKQVEAAKAMEQELREKAELTRVHEATIKDLQSELSDRPNYGKPVFEIAKKIVAKWDVAADAAKGRLREKLSRMSAGVDPTIIVDVAEIIRAEIGKVGLKEAEIIARVSAEFGNKIKPFLKDAWDYAVNLIDKEAMAKPVKERVKKGTKKDKPADIKARMKADAVAGDELSHQLVYELARTKIAEGIHGEDPVMKAVHVDVKEFFPDATERDVRRAFSEYGKAKFPSKEADKVELAELRNLTRLQESIDRLTEGRDALKTGLQRDKASQAIREKQKQLNELLKRRQGPPSPAKLATNLEARKTALRNQIEDLDKQLRTGEKPPAKTPPTPLDAEGERMVAERDAMKQKLREIEMEENPPKSEAEKQVEQLAKIRQRMDDVLSGKVDPKTGKPFVALSDAAADIKAEILAMQELAAQMRRDAKPKKDPNYAKEQAQIKALERSIARYEARTNAKDFSPAGRMHGPDTLKVSQLKDIRDARKAVYDAAKLADKPVLTPEEKYNATRLKVVNKRMADIRERIRTGDYAKTPKRETPKKSKEVLDAEYALEQEKQAFNQGVFELALKNRSTARKIAEGARDTLNTARAVMTSFDLSAVLRQGGFVVVSHPIRGARAVPDMIKAMLSEKGRFEVNDEILGRDNALLYKSSGLYLNDPNATSLYKMEEAYMSRWASKIWGVAHSERAYTTYLNRLRADSFDAMVGDRAMTDKEYKAIANFINVATGRGNLASQAGAAVSLNTAFFSPRYVLSRFELIAGQPFYQGSLRTRGLIAKEYAQYLIGMGVIYALGLFAGGSIEKDPRSSEFGKIRIGNTRIDPLSGLSQVSVLLYRIRTGETKTARGEIKKIRGNEVGFGDDDTWDVIGKFLRSKLSPVIGASVDIVTGKNVIGEPITPTNALIRMVSPLSMNDIYEVMAEQGVGRGTALALLSVLGAGIQTYQPKPRTGPPRPPRPPAPPRVP